MAELVDAADSKSAVRKDVQVRFLFWALSSKRQLLIELPFLFQTPAEEKFNYFKQSQIIAYKVVVFISFIQDNKMKSLYLLLLCSIDII